ncbi:MAG TPA: CHAT domain-containing tetratricopeptide repeat protein [Bryobacteraceae bacterium]
MDEQIQALCAELGGLPDEESRGAFLNRSPELLQSAVVAYLADAVRQKVRVDLAEAFRLASGAVAIAGRLQDEEAMALSLRAKANTLWFMGECKPAVDLFREAATLFERAGNMNEVGRTLSTSIQSLALLGEYEAAFSAAARARDIFAGLGETLRIARLEINVANIYHRQNHFAQALAAYRRAYEQLLPHNDKEAAGVALHNMAVCLIALDDFHGALETYRQMRDFCRQQDMPLLVAQADYNIAYLFYLRGDYTQALELLRASRDSCSKNGDKYHLGLCDLDQSEIYLELGLVAEAAEMAEKSFAQFEELGINYEAARSLANSAVAAGLEGDAARSLGLFARAKQMMLLEKNQVWPSLLDLYQALVLFNEGDFSEAHRLCTAALEFFGSAQIPSKHVLSLLLLARVCLKTGEVEAASHHCGEALRRVSGIDAPILAYQAEFLMGQVYEALRKPEEAYHSYRKSRSVLDDLRGGLQTEELKIAFMKDKTEVYGRLVQLCLDRDSGQASREEAFSYVEEAKSRILRDLLFGRLHPPVAPDSAESETGRRISELRKELNWCYRRLEREQLSQDGIAPELVESMRSRARAYEHELLRLIREAPASDPASGNFRGSQSNSLEQIRASLGAETSLVEYFCAGDRVFAAVLTPHTLDFVPVTTVSGITPRLRMLQFQMSKFRLGLDYIARFSEVLMRATQDHLQAIHEEVFAPLRPLLKTRQLVIVPYGLLHSLPFHALFDGQQSLIDAFTISYAPSASIHALCQQQVETHAGPSLVLGVEDAKTPFVRQEVEAVGSVVREAKILLGPDASERALRKDGGRSQLIHIASHGYFRQDSPMFSAIRLADSYLSLYDLYHMDLPVDLLTLSGCVTGLSVIAEGDELIGLSRGLLYAGARSLLLSLWDVDDHSTAEFMKLFYSHLLHQPSKAEALRSAMLDLRKNYPHPYYWAPFRLMGKSFD